MAETILGKVCPTPKGVYNANTKYEKLDIIQHDGNGYMVLKECTGVLPSESEYYMLLSARGSDGANGSDGVAGADGKSAYQAAVEAGYTGTETEFAALMNSIADKQDKIIGTIGQVVGFDSMGLPHAAHWWSNKNLVINGDFRNPVNQNGKSNYVDHGITIDKWKNETNSGALTVNDASVTFSWNRADPSIYAALTQSIDRRKDLLGKVCTWSMLAKGTGTIYLSAGDENNERLLINLTDEPTLYTITVPLATLEFLGGLSHWRIVADGEYCSLTGEIEMFAVKLEEGSVQTLAHQDADGNWVLNDPVDYDFQYALCSQYSPNTWEWVGSQYINQNLLDNAYWADKIAIINQRGKEYYQLETNGYIYTIDRWTISTATFPDDADKKAYLSISDKYLEFGSTNPGIKGEDLSQIIENTFRGKTVTLSILVTPDSSPFALHIRRTDWTPYNEMQCEGGELYTITASIPDDASSNLRVSISSNGIFSVKVIAMKLELGSVQTLAHKEGDTWALNDPPPDKALELTKCQRHQIMFDECPCVIGYGIAQTNESVLCEIPTPVTMHGNPAITYENIGLFGTGGMTTAGSLEIIEIFGVFATKNGIRLQAKTTGATVGNSYILVIKENGYLMIDKNL